MEKYHLKDDIKVFGIEVKTFPSGIGEAFKTLAEMITEGYNRSYYGISQMSSEGIIYKAAAEENYEYEAEKYNCDRFMIEKGEYLIVTVKDWRKKIHSLKDVFTQIMHDNQYDDTKPCVEWYKNDDEILCMVKCKNALTKEL